MTRIGTKRNTYVSFTALLWLMGGGCSQLIDPKVPEPLRPFVEPETQREYVLYRPSGYDASLAWPLVIVCHSGGADSHRRQIRHWTELAESRGILVAAPKLVGTRGAIAPKAASQLQRQREDEHTILATIRHICAGHSISTDRIFIHGYSGGAYAALHTGLKNPRTFRAVSAIAPKFASGFLTDVQDRIDPYQPVYINYSVSDRLTGRQGRECVEWMRSKGVNLRDNPTGGAHADDTRQVVSFYEETIRTSAWMHIRAFPAEPSNPLSIRFKLQSSFTPSTYRWDFGDGDESPVAEPLHVFAEPGTYVVSVTVTGLKNATDTRKIQLQVPDARIKQVDSE